MTAHIRAICGKTCGCADPCDFAERIAETGREDWERDPLGWEADRMADEYERRVLDGRWSA